MFIVGPMIPWTTASGVSDTEPESVAKQ